MILPSHQLITKSRILYDHSANELRHCVASSLTANMALNSSGLSVGGTFVPASDKRLKFNEKPLGNALDVISKLAPVEYDQTHDLVEQYTSDTPQSHHCGFIAESVQSIDELQHAVLGGQVCDDGKESIRARNYNTVFTYVVKSHSGTPRDSQ
ncbi:MAG: tail fiber domain-containing protein, partial [Candidatus Fonsibacter sp.]